MLTSCGVFNTQTETNPSCAKFPDILSHLGTQVHGQHGKDTRVLNLSNPRDALFVGFCGEHSRVEGAIVALRLGLNLESVRLTRVLVGETGCMLLFTHWEPCIHGLKED